MEKKECMDLRSVSAESEFLEEYRMLIDEYWVACRQQD